VKWYFSVAVIRRSAQMQYNYESDYLIGSESFALLFYYSNICITCLTASCVLCHWRRQS